MKISKKAMEKFNNNVREALEMYGVESLDEIKYFTKSRKLGKINFTLDPEPSEMYSIFIRFEEPEKAKGDFDCNTYNGKYNIHTFNYNDAMFKLGKVLSIAELDDL